MDLCWSAWVLAIALRLVEWTIRAPIRSFGRGFLTTPRVPRIWRVCAGQMVSMSGLRRRSGMADLDAALEVRRLWAQDLGHGRDDLSSHPHAAEHVVCRDLAGDLAEERGLGTESARHARPGLLRDRVGVAAQAAPRDGPSRTRAAGGVVEVDESFVGGRATGKRGASTDKVPVMIAVENVGTQVKQETPPGSGAAGCRRLPRLEAAGRLRANHRRAGLVDPHRRCPDVPRSRRARASPTSTSRATLARTRHVTLPGPHRVASLLKRWNAGTHHYRVEREHLPYYLDEFTFRFNRRRSQLAACSSTGSCNKASTPTRTRCTSSLSAPSGHRRPIDNYERRDYA